MKKRSLALSSMVAGAALASTAGAAPDVVLCQLYELTQWTTDGTVRGLAMGTTSWNIGTTDLLWYENPDPRHPFIAMNMYRRQNNRFEQIGTGWVKHGFYALANLQCDMPELPNCVFEPGHGEGDYLGQGCTDSYEAFLNAFGLQPRHEVNPWTAAFDYNTSLQNIGGGPGNKVRQLRVEDADLNPALHFGATYYFEGYYVHFQDENPLNNAAWKTCSPVRDGSGNYTFNYSPETTLPNWGFALDSWGGTQTVIAEEVPPVKGVSPDGRCILSYKTSINLDGTWHYEYALLNADMDRQVDSFSIPIPAGVTVTNIGFHAPAHTESNAWVGGPAIDNQQWVGSVSGGAITWTTTTNPLRWGTLHNYRFDADAPPGAVNATLGLFRPAPGRPDDLGGATDGPVAAPACPGDIAGSGGGPDGLVNVEDLNALLGAWGQTVGIGDPRDLAGGDGVVNVEDLNVVLGAWGQAC